MREGIRMIFNAPCSPILSMPFLYVIYFSKSKPDILNSKKVTK